MRRDAKAHGQGLSRAPLAALPQRRVSVDGGDAGEARGTTAGSCCEGVRGGRQRRLGRRSLHPGRLRRRWRGDEAPAQPRQALTGHRPHQAGPLQRTRQVASRRVRHARGNRPLGKDHAGGAAGRGARPRHAPASRTRRNRRGGTDPGAAQASRHRARLPRGAAPVLRRPGGALRAGDQAGGGRRARRGLRSLRRLDRRLPGRGARTGGGPGGAPERDRDRRMLAGCHGPAADRSGAGRGPRPAAARRRRGGRLGPLRGRGDRAPAARGRGLRGARRTPPGPDRRRRRRGLGGGGTRSRDARGGRRAGAGVTTTAEIPESVREATDHQRAARAALAAALAAPGHAYLFAGPPGSGKRAAARAFAGELLAAVAPDPDEARRRAVSDPPSHPDLVWLAPHGTQHLVDEVRRRVITAAAYRPFEGERRVFVIEAAEAMADESQNALLKTLEEPAAYVHLILTTSQPAALLETVRSRCQTVLFAPLADEAAGRRPADAPRARLATLAAEAGQDEGPAAGRRARETEEAARRAARRARTDALDLGLALVAAWLRDLAAVAEGVDGLVLNADRVEGLRAAGVGRDARRARRGAELVMETRRRLQVNVAEELALEALLFRLEALLRDA